MDMAIYLPSRTLVTGEREFGCKTLVKIPSIVNTQWILDTDMIMMLSGISVDVPASATSRWKTRQLPS